MILRLFLGIDIGTSGVRTSVINLEKTELSSSSVPMEPPGSLDGRPAQDPEIWWQAVDECLTRQADALADTGNDMGLVEALAVDGTSGTLLLADKNLQPVTAGLMYNSAGFREEAETIEQAAPADSIARGPSSALARLLFAQKLHGAENAHFALHQADWIAARLLGRGGNSDENNVLKLGYDLVSGAWPEWFAAAGVRTDLLPKVSPVGRTTGRAEHGMAKKYGLGKNTRIVAGTTDSNASFLASGASSVGEGSTSLGTTLAIKLISDREVSSPEHGVYSHRLFGKWMAGGASNSGGGALLAHFRRDEIARLQTQLKPETDTGLNYYPLAGTGERFPLADPELKSRVTPRPEKDSVFLQGLLEGIALVERRAYETLAQLGAPRVQSVKTTGGGGANEAWTSIRRRILGCPVSPARADAAYGAALIALSSAQRN